MINAFVGAEYVIANALIALEGIKKDPCISVSKIRSIGVQLQQFCNKNNIGAVIMTSGLHISNAIENFSDYFEYIEPISYDFEPAIRIQKGIPVSRLKQRFIGYFPLEVVRVLLTELPKLL